MSHLTNWLQVNLRGSDPHAPVFEVKTNGAGWFYHQKAGGNITNVSQIYYGKSSKSHAKRAAYAQAVRIPGSIVKVLPPPPAPAGDSTL